MADKQPKALRLAQGLNNRQECEDDAADELRRLYEENQSLRAALAQAEPVAEEIKQQALDALNRMQSILMMSDGRHPRDVLRTYIQLTAAPLPQQQAEPLQDLIPPDSLFVCDQMGAHVTRVRLAQQAEPVQFDPAEAMRLADDYASAQSEMDVEQNLNRRPYYIESRNAARATLAAYLGIKGGGNG